MAIDGSGRLLRRYPPLFAGQRPEDMCKEQASVGAARLPLYQIDVSNYGK
ncbi:hypothetical protein MUN89_16270 [Halobacillus salinarum]|uniref:Uncharacterized protein n=1 Tax=Halobacillus salinarum TaxID=2932257 RepID=A0ABY4EH28_9BACI|nr:hypothetical protein [Halobacillus salinarum]UOQ43459.1 hypothetical protein MUN89_16270 [Halobacillus salinarum]